MIHIFKIVTFKHNRTTAAQNITVKFKIDVRDGLEVVVQAFKFLSNEYRRFPMRFQVNINKAFQANVGGSLKMISCGNITSCYFYKDITYHICNFILDPTYLLPLIPTGQYKVQLIILYENQPIAEIHIFGEVYTPLEYPKK